MEKLKETNDKLNEFKDLYEVAAIIDDKDLLYKLYYEGNINKFDLHIISLLSKYDKELKEEHIEHCDFKNRNKAFKFFDSFLTRQGLKKIYDHFKNEVIKKYINWIYHNKE